MSSFASEERLPRSCVSALIEFNRMVNGGFGRGSQRTKAARTAPHCGCCGVECAIVDRQPVRRCSCNPFAATCPRCSRAACHCRCVRITIVFQEKL